MFASGFQALPILNMRIGHVPLVIQSFEISVRKSSQGPRTLRFGQGLSVCRDPDPGFNVGVGALGWKSCDLNAGEPAKRACAFIGMFADTCASGHFKTAANCGGEVTMYEMCSI